MSTELDSKLEKLAATLLAFPDPSTAQRLPKQQITRYRSGLIRATNDYFGEIAKATNNPDFANPTFKASLHQLIRTICASMASTAPKNSIDAHYLLLSAYEHRKLISIDNELFADMAIVALEPALHTPLKSALPLIMLALCRIHHPWEHNKFDAELRKARLEGAYSLKLGNLRVKGYAQKLAESDLTWKFIDAAAAEHDFDSIGFLFESLRSHGIVIRIGKCATLLDALLNGISSSLVTHTAHNNIVQSLKWMIDPSNNTWADTHLMLRLAALSFTPGFADCRYIPPADPHHRQLDQLTAALARRTIGAHGPQ